MEQWKGKIAVVTGASSGIGRQILLDLANAGMIAIGLARNKERILEIAKKNKNASERIFAHKCDLTRVASIKAAFRWIEVAFGVVHVLINNAGSKKIAETLSDRITHSEIQAIINCNFSGLVICTREAYGLMLKHTDAAFIVNVNSILGQGSAHSFFRFMNVYSAAKQAVRQHTHVIRQDLAVAGNTRIRVSVSSRLEGDFNNYTLTHHTEHQPWTCNYGNDE